MTEPGNPQPASTERANTQPASADRADTQPAGAEPANPRPTTEPPQSQRPDVAHLRTLYFVIHRTVRRNLEGVSHEESLRSPEPFGNNANWVLGHLVDSAEGVLGLLGQPRVLDSGALARYRRGTSPLIDAAEALPLERLLEVWDEASKRINVGLKSIPEERVDAPVPADLTWMGTTIGAAVAFVSFHQSYHAGQLGLLRRLLGKPGAIA
ncbi:MAG: DinB family protein [Trueperaceae bacterium]